eukprot:TRINITY_DN3687_c0_g1_i1.p1 TRINITY_DN3687_c0_g1~~TRINITY_DN3687_c0_g1_i1.p1  ORF type:complete len:347 (-),score=91.67 TRINITY_DN3687_c0_g1_i1:154-1194(-)
MKQLLTLLLALTLAQCFTYKEFRIPLESSPLSRFDAPNRYFMGKTLNFIKIVVNLVSNPLKAQLFQIYNDIVRKRDFEFAMEMKGVSLFLKVPERELFVFAFLYEIFAHCTSIVAALPDGTIIHGRNLDYNFVQLLNETTYVAVFTREGREVFRCVMYGGFLGSHTCMKKGKFAISLNQRMNDPREGIRRNMQALSEGGAITPWTIRQTARKAESYEEAVSVLQSTKLAGISYFIVSGAGEYEAAVITRARNSTLDTWRLSKSEWFLVQVNTDRWKPIPPKQVDRRTPAVKRMKVIGQKNLTMERMMNEVLTKKPNDQSITVFSVVMVPQSGKFMLKVKEANTSNE